MIVPILLAAASGFGLFDEYKPRSVLPSGFLREFLVRQVSGTTGNRLRLGYPYDGCLWAGSVKDVWFEEELPYSRRFAAPREEIWWPYEQAAYFLDGMIRLSQLVPADDLRAEFMRSLEFCLSHQDERDGDLFRAYSSSGCQWPMVVFFRAALAYYDETGDGRVKAAFIRHYEGKRGGPRHPYDRDVLNVEGMLKVYEWTQDEAFLKDAEEWFSNHYYGKRFRETDRVHSHGVSFAEALKIPALLYAQSGREEWRILAVKAMRDVFRLNETPAGQVSATEYLSGRAPWEGFETCVASDMLCSLGAFLAMDGNCEAADHMERIAYNALPGAVTKDFTRHQYISMPNQVVATPFSYSCHSTFAETDWNRFRACHFAQCCSGNVNRAMPLFVQRMWMRRRADGAPVAMLLGPGMLHAETAGVRYGIVCSGDYPFGDTLSYRFDFPGKDCLDSPFLVRVPGWAKSATFRRNGTVVDLAARPGTLAEIPGPWRSGDVLDVKFDQDVTLASDRHWHWLRRGALTFVLPVRTTCRPEREGDRFSDLTMDSPSPFNFAFDLQEIGAAGLKAEKRVSPYAFETPGMVLRVPMREIEEWRVLDEGRFTPHVPLVAHQTGRRVELEFVPYATTETRITAFPDTQDRELFPIVRVYAAPECYPYDPSRPLSAQKYAPEDWSDEKFVDADLRVQRSPDFFCDLESHYHTNTCKVGYLLFRFWSATEGKVTCALGASKCVQAFFEGREVYSNGPIVEGRLLAPYWFDITAKKGYNYLKVKVADPGKQVVFGQDQYRREWGAKLEVFRNRRASSGG